MTLNSNTKGQLDPGAPPRRKGTSGCKCLLYSTMVFVLSCIAILFVFFFTTFLNEFSAPHKKLYHSTTSLENVADRATVVQPLIDRDQIFDLAATVWLRTSSKRHQNEPLKKDTKDAAGRGELGGIPGDSQPLSEEALFSDIIFKGVHLTDKNLLTTVNFTMPTALFRDTNLTNYDLRASVVLIPRAPSLMDFVANYSSYLPDSVTTLPVRSWPFPLDSGNHRIKSLADEALESFGVSVPLIQFYSAQSRCTSKTEVTSAFSEGEDGEIEEEDVSFPKKRVIGSSLEVTDGQPVLKSHPYVVTRTQIRILDEVHLYDRKAYITAHKKLKQTSCGQDLLVHPNSYSCKGGYLQNGNWETMLRLRIPDKTNDKIRIEWAYAPFIALSQNAFGQKDLLDVPVNRENCTVDGKATETSEVTSIDVAWKVSYSGRSPGMMNTVDIWDQTNVKFNSSGTSRDQIIAHDNSELRNGLFGHAYREGAHPRRRLLIMFFIQPVLLFAIFCLRTHYWFTRRSTVSISIPATIILAMCSIIEFLDSVITDVTKGNHSIAGWMFNLLWAATFSLVLPFLQLKAVFRMDFGCSHGWVPVLRRAEATHLERASERLEAQTSGRIKAGLFLSVLATYYFLEPHKYAVIAELIPPSESPTDSGIVPAPVLMAMETVGIILQIVLNWRSGTYAGGYKVLAPIALIWYSTIATTFIPAVVGTFDSRESLSAHFLIEFTLALFGVWQVLTMPSVGPVSEEDHVE